MKFMSKICKSLKKYGFLLIIIVLVIVVGCFFNIKSFKSNSNIEKILESENYAYLPESAKKYIKDAYMATGDVILTEKNKVENVPYLNPAYISYLELSKEEQAKVNVVPEAYILDYVSTDVTSSFPSSYDLRDVSGKNYITPLKNQSSSGMCWGFTSFEQVESYLLLKNNTSYSSSSPVFSPRQLDYATSYEGIKDYNNKDGSRALYTEGGNFFLATIMMANGLTLTSESMMPFSNSQTKKNYADVFNYENSLYEVNGTVAFPNLKASPTEDELTSYVNSVKGLVMNNGGAYVGTDSPTGKCSSTGSDGSRLIRVDNSCSIVGHAMQIIGWDDDYSYSYCKTGTTHNSNVSNCSESNLISKKGAWILRNSWGVNTSYSYVYLAYDSMGSDINLSTDVSALSSRNWDNNYHKNAYENKIVLISNSDKINFQKDINTSEKLEKVKFLTSGSDGTYNISVVSGSKTYKDIKTINTTYPGLYTVDLSENNIIIDENNFTVEIASTNSVKLIVNSISAFTSNINENPVIETDDLKFNVDSSGYEVVLYSNTKNIPSGSVVNYTLYRGNTNVSDYLTVENNKVGINGINAKIMINGAIASGSYTLKTTYSGSEFTSKIEIANYVNLTGSGTIVNPYLIHNEDELKQMNYALDSSFKLVNDITLTSPWEPIGSEQMPFTGTFDGDNHTISGLTITGDTYSHNGLFGYVELSSYETIAIKNLIIKDPKVNVRNDASALIGKVMGMGLSSSSSANYNMDINNVYIMDGSITSEYGNAGSLIASLEVPYALNGKNTFNFDSIFASSTVYGATTSGLIGHILGGRIEANSVILNLTNIQTMGRIGIDVYARMATHGTIVGNALNYANITLDNYLSTNMFYGMLIPAGEYNPLVASYQSSVTLNVKNGYGLFTSSSANANLKKNIEELKDPSLYSSWNDFSSKWKIEKIDGYQRIPILKDVPFIYSDVNDITLHVGETVLVSDYLNLKSPNSIFINTATPESSVITFNYVYSKLSRFIYDYEITANEPGVATFNVVNKYDGLNKNIKVTVLEEEKIGTLTLNSNDGKGNTSIQNYIQNVEFILNNNPFDNPGYTFKNWNTKADGSGTNYNPGDSITLSQDSFALYAIWTPITYNVEFNANGGSGTMNSVTYSYGESFNLLNNAFTRLGYAFDGWNTKADGTGINYTNMQNVQNLTTTDRATVILYAKWKANTYTVLFNANGGSGTMSSMSLTYDIATNLKANTFSKNGMKFKSWNTKADGSGTSYADKASVKNLATSGSVTLYAIWEENYSYTVNKYTVDNNLKLIDNIGAKTSLDSFKNNFNLSSNVSVQVDLGTKKYIYTGSKTKIYFGSRLAYEYTNIVRGDANGDGQITSLDYVRVKNHIMNIKITNTSLLKGADANKDNKISSLDYVRIKNTIMGG